MLLSFLFGLSIGSFLAGCIQALPVPPSVCKHCHRSLRPVDLIPVVSWLLTGGKCRYCGQAAAARYAALVELLCGGMFLWAFIHVGFTRSLAAAFLLASFLLTITFIDFEHQLILDKVLLPMAITGIVVSVYTGTVNGVQQGLAALGGGSIMLFLAILARGGLGGGDIKLMAVLGLWLGWPGIGVALFLSFFFGGIAGVFLLLFNLKGRKDAIPFGPYIAAAAWLTFLYGKSWLAWYLDVFW